MKKLIVWKWMANVADHALDPGVVGIRVCGLSNPWDNCLVGRSGWVGYEEGVKNYGKKIFV